MSVADALGDGESASQDSFASHPLLDCPHYSRPEDIAGRVVRVVGGRSHKALALKRSLIRTRDRRPDLFANCN